MKILRAVFFLGALAAISHEIFCLITINAVEPTGSTVTRFLVLAAVLFLGIHERTNIFDEGMFRIKKWVCRIAIAVFAAVILVVYATRFSEAPTASMIHRYAPVNAILAVFFFFYTVIALAGDSFLGKVRAVFKWWREDKGRDAPS